jgi:ribosomal protein L24E
MRTGYANRSLRIRMHGSIHDPTARVKQEVVACQNWCRRVSLVTTLPKDLPWSIYIRVYKHTHTHTHTYIPSLLGRLLWLLSNYPDLAGGYFKLIPSVTLPGLYAYMCIYPGEGNCFVLNKTRVYAKIMNNHNIMQFFCICAMHVIMMDFLLIMVSNY